MSQAADRHCALIVEDDAQLREIACAILEETELKPVEVDSAEAALVYLREHAPDVALVFTDIHLAGRVDGIQLASCISVRWPWIVVLVTSENEGDGVRDLPRGAVFIPKPWHRRDVLTYAERAIKDPRSAAIGTPW